MSKDVALFNAQVPAYLSSGADAAKMNQAAAAGTMGVSVNKIGIKGAKFRLNVGGQEVKVLEQNALKLAVIRAADGLNKAWFAKAWAPGSDDQPDCSSDDGIKPRADSPNKQAAACAGCPRNEWGSYINPQTQTKGKACSDSKRLAVLPPGQLGGDLPPYQLQVPAASLKEFGGMVSSLNNLSPAVPYNAVIVEVSFDTDASYPRLLFRPAEYLSAEQYQSAKDRYDVKETKDCVGMTLIPVTDVTETRAAPTPTPTASAEADEPAEDMTESVWLHFPEGGEVFEGTRQDLIDSPELEAVSAAQAKVLASKYKRAAEAAKPTNTPETKRAITPAVETGFEEEEEAAAPEKPKPKPKPRAKPRAKPEAEAEAAAAPEKPAASAAPVASSDLDDVFGAEWDD